MAAGASWRSRPGNGTEKTHSNCRYAANVGLHAPRAVYGRCSRTWRNTHRSLCPDGKLEPVFQAMLENATRICEAKFGTLFRFDGKNFHPAATFNTPTALREVQTRRGPFQPPSGSMLDRVMRTKRVSHTADYVAEAVSGPAATFGGARSLVAVPMLKDDSLIGVIAKRSVRSPTSRSH
jgi:GAF domain-containing protein